MNWSKLIAWVVIILSIGVVSLRFVSDTLPSTLTIRMLIIIPLALLWAIRTIRRENQKERDIKEKEAQNASNSTSDKTAD